MYVSCLLERRKNVLEFDTRLLPHSMYTKSIGILLIYSFYHTAYVINICQHSHIHTYVTAFCACPRLNVFIYLTNCLTDYV